MPRPNHNIKRILIVEDDEQDSQALARLLKRAGFTEILFASRGREGVDLHRVEKPDLVITDTRLPDIDGFEVCRAIRKIDASALIIVTTGHVDSLDAEKALSAGANDYVAKSVGYGSIIDAAKNLLVPAGGETQGKVSAARASLKKMIEPNFLNEGTRIFFVEDDMIVANTFMRRLRKSSSTKLEITHVGSLGTALAHLSRNDQYDVILLDMSLPDASGLEAVSSLRKNSPHLPIIILTGSNDAKLPLLALKMGAQDYLLKQEINIQMLSRAIRYTIERNRLTQQARWVSVKTNAGVKTLYKRLEKQHWELAKLNQMKSYFVSIVSHDFRSPVTVIHGAASGLLEEPSPYGKLNEDQKRFLEMIHRNAGRLNEMVGRILNLSTIQTKNPAAARKKTSIKPIIEIIVADMQLQAKEKKVTLESHVPDGLPELWLDPPRIEQVLVNLTSNALKYASGGGLITLSAEEVNGHIQVTVKDKGPGIPRELHETIFKRFEQLDETNSAGVGLGLAICKDFISRHNGKIWVESTLGHGSRFIFKLPLDQKAEQPPLQTEEEIPQQ